MEKKAIQEELEKMRVELKGIRGKYKKVLEDCRKIDAHKIYCFLCERGYGLMESEVGFKFMTDKQGPVYLATTARLPLFELSLSFDARGKDVDALLRVAREVTENSLMVKSYVYQDRFVLSLATIESDVRHFRRCFDLYMEQLNNCYDELARLYDNALNLFPNIGQSAR